MSIRKPVAAGAFYPSEAEEIKSMISSFVVKKTQKEDVLGCVLPHAGYIYSGKVAAETVSGINIKDTVLLLGPNHTGQGAEFSIMPKGTWQTPLGNLEINEQLANLLLNKCPYLREDGFAHLDEHSLEVELPILQYFKRDFSIVPIAFKAGNLSALIKIAQGLAKAIMLNGLKSSVTLIASSDLTHYEEQESAQRKDALAIEAITALDEKKLESVVKKFDISMCGFSPVAVLLKTAKLLGAKTGRLIKYQTSGEANNDFSSVVGYAGITIY